jgi:hypothetical protein
VVGGVLSQSVARWLSVALLAGLVACSGGSGGERSTPPKTTAAPTTTPPATIDLSKPIPGGSLHGTPRPPLENTGADYVAIFKSLIANQRWISENPTTSAISDVYVPGTPAHDARVSAYQYLVDNGYRWADEGYQLISVVVISSLPDAVTLRVVQQFEFERVVDSNGAQVGQVRQGTGPETSTVLLTRDAEGRWRIADATPNADSEVQL